MDRAIQKVRNVRVVDNYKNTTEERKARSKVKPLTDRKQESKGRVNQAGPLDVRRNTPNLGRGKLKTMVMGQTLVKVMYFL